MSKSTDFNKATGIFRCHACEKTVGSTYVFGINKEISENTPGTDWQRFFTYSEYKLHMRTIHGVSIGKGPEKELFSFVPYCLCTNTGHVETCRCSEELSIDLRTGKDIFTLKNPRPNCPCFDSEFMRPFFKSDRAAE